VKALAQAHFEMNLQYFNLC